MSYVFYIIKRTVERIFSEIISCKKTVNNLAFFVLISCGLNSVTTFALEVKIGDNNGVPGIFINGELVGGRMLFVPRSWNPVEIGSEASKIKILARATQDVDGDGALSISFHNIPTMVWLDNMTISEVESNRIIFDSNGFEDDKVLNIYDFPQNQKVCTRTFVAGKGENGSRALQLKLAPSSGKWARWHMKISGKNGFILKSGHHYKIEFWAYAEKKTVMKVMVCTPWVEALESERLKSQITLAGKAGVNFITIPFPLLWSKGDQKTDYRIYDGICAEVQRCNPAARIIVRVHLDPPEWWLRKYPEELSGWAGQAPMTVSPASLKWRKEARQKLSALINYLEKHHGEVIAGYHPCAMATGEWYYHGAWRDIPHGFAPVEKNAYRRWLRKHYCSDMMLQKAWCNNSVSLDTATPPTKERYKAVSKKIWLLPGTDQDMIDYNFFLQENMADAALEMANTVRSITGGSKLSLLFYGYGFEFGALPRMAAAGHYALRKILASPDVDIVCGPISYVDRQLGEQGPVMAAAESVKLAGKIWLDEDDTRTHLREPNTCDKIVASVDISQTRGILMRNLSQQIMKNYASWWMDLLGQGWYDQQEIWDTMHELSAFAKDMLQHSRPFKPGIALILSELSAAYLSRGGRSLSYPALYRMRGIVGHCGIPYGQYLLDDVLSGKLPQESKLLIFCNAWALTQQERIALRKNTEGKMRLWIYMAGDIDPAGINSAFENTLTGFKLKKINPENMTIEVTSLGRSMGFPEKCVSSGVRPPFAYTVIDAGADEALALYPDGSVAVALRKTMTGIDLFCGIPNPSPAFIRAAAAIAGIHIYSADNDVICANGSYLMIHASSDGTHCIKAPYPCIFLDAISGIKLGSGSEVRLKIKTGETRLLKMEKL